MTGVQLAGAWRKWSNHTLGSWRKLIALWVGGIALGSAILFGVLAPLLGLEPSELYFSLIGWSVVELFWLLAFRRAGQSESGTE